jgi:hypothetical protein
MDGKELAAGRHIASRMPSILAKPHVPQRSLVAHQCAEISEARYDYVNSKRILAATWKGADRDRAACPEVKNAAECGLQFDPTQC